MLVVAVGAGLVIRFKCRASDDKPTAKPAAPVVADALVVETPIDASVAVDDEPVPEDDPPAYNGPELVIGALTADRKRALLIPVQGEQWWRVVEIDSGKIETDLELESFAEPSDPANEALLGDLVRARAVLRDFPLGAHRFGQVASTADGTRGAFNAGDPLHLVAGDKLGAKIALPAAYEPMITPDGTLLMRGYDGRIDDEGKYSLFAMPIAGGKPKKIAGTDGFTGIRAISSAGLRIVVAQPPSIPTCVLDISLAKPVRVIAKVCPEGKYEGDITLSPSGDYLAWSTEDRVRSMELATKRVDLDVERSGNLFVSDEGRVVIANDDGVVVWEPKLQQLRDSAKEIDHRCMWRNANEMVCTENGTVRVVAP
jgi:hypothetical protein